MSSKSKKTSQLVNKDLGAVLNDALLAQEIYNIHTKAESKAHLQELVGNKMELVLFTDELLGNEAAHANHYRAALFVNNETKEIKVVTAGTRMEEGAEIQKSDLLDDTMLAAAQLPSKFRAAQALNEMIVENFGKELADYTIHYTGHSLGAALSDMAAADMALRMRNADMLEKGKVSSTTFDNPGVKEIVAKMLPKDFNASKLKEMVHFEAYNNRDNFINTMGSQMDEKYDITPSTVESRGFVSDMIDTLATPVCKVADSVTTNKIIQIATVVFTPWIALAQVAKACSYGTFDTQIGEHSITNHIAGLQEMIVVAGETDGFDSPVFG
jgi:hypothetical protein